MSIENLNGKTVLRVSTLWEWAFKLFLVVTPMGFLGLMSFMGWLTLKVLAHDNELARINGRMEAVAVGSVKAPAASVAAHVLQAAEILPP